MTKLRVGIALIMGLLLVGAQAGCSSPEPTAVAVDTVVVDVRTPDEFAEGHLEGAVNIDLDGPDFAGAIGELPRDGEYVLYCRSGNRSGQAAAIMDQLDFQNVVDLGSIENASSSTSLPVVTD